MIRQREAAIAIDVAAVPPAAARPAGVTPRPSAMRLMIRVDAGEQARAVVAAAELRRDRLADRLAGESVGDELLEAVADLDRDLAILHRDDARAGRCPCPLSPMPRAAVLEHLDGVLVDVGVRLEGRHRRDDDDVAAGRLQRADPPLELALALAESMTLAKSLTGAVSAAARAAPARREAPAARATSSRQRRAAECARSCHQACARQLSTYSQIALGGGDVAAEQRRRLGDRPSWPLNAVLRGRRDHLAHARLPANSASASSAVRRQGSDGPVVEPRDVARGARGRPAPTTAIRCADRVGIAARLRGMPRAGESGGSWPGARTRAARRSRAIVAPANGSAPRSMTWCAMISPYSSGKTSSVRRNSSRARISGTASERRRQPCRAAAAGVRSAKVRRRRAPACAASRPAAPRCDRRRRRIAAARRRFVLQVSSERSSRAASPASVIERFSPVRISVHAAVPMQRNAVQIAGLLILASYQSDIRCRSLMEWTADAAAQAERRLLRRRHRAAEPARRPEDQPVAQRQRRRHDVRQRRQLRASCATSWACCRRATC